MKRATSIPFMYLEGNRSKTSVAIDLKDPAGRDEFRELVRGADVVIENARAGVWDRLGLGEDALHELNPDLIYARSKGYGIEGPYRQAARFRTRHPGDDRDSNDTGRRRAAANDDGSGVRLRGSALSGNWHSLQPLSAAG